MNKKLILTTVSICISLLSFSQMENTTISIGSDTDIGHSGDIILKDKGVNDPHIHIFNDTAYLFASHDKGTGYSDYTMEDWNIFSSPDLVHWTERFVLKPEDTFIGSKIDKCFATDGAERNGKYYFYFSNFNKSTGVAVSSSGPGGPYIDHGTPILPENLTRNNEYDPTIFIDDDNTPYIIWGYTGWGTYYQIAELNEDMVSLKTSPKNLKVIDDILENDASYLHKHNGIYYLSTHHGKYATSDNLMGPYTYRGTVAAHGDHGTYFTWHNQTYYTWGGWQSAYFRHSQITYCHYKDNGEIVANSKIGNPSLGVGRYDASWDKIEAEWFFAASDKLDKRENATGFEIRNIQNHTYLFFPRVHNFPTDAFLQLNLSCNSSNNATIEVRCDSTTGHLLGSCEITNTGGWDKYKTFNCSIESVSNPKNIYLVFKGDDEEIIRLDWLKFSSPGVFIESENNVDVGEEIELHTYAFPSDITNEPLIISNSNADNAILKNDNTLEGIRAGISTITVKTADGVFSNSKIININTPTSIENKKKNNPISIYPNPTTGAIHIKNIDDKKLIVSLQNISGELVLKENGKKTIDISNLPKGIYIVTAVSDTEKRSFKVVKK